MALADYECKAPSLTYPTISIRPGYRITLPRPSASCSVLSLDIVSFPARVHQPAAISSMSSQGTVSDEEETRDIVADNLGAIKKQIFDTSRFASMWHEAQNEMESLRAEVDGLREQLAAPRECGDCVTLQTEIKTLKADLVKAKKESSTAKVREATKKAKAAAEEAVSRLTEDLKSSQANLQQRELDLTEERARAADLHSELEKLKSALAARPATPPPPPAVDDTQLRRLRKENDSLQRQLKDVRDSNRCIQNDLQESAAELELTKAKLVSLRTECKDLKTRLVAATSASSQVADAQSATADSLLAQEFEQIKDSKKLLEFELKGARSQLAARADEISSKDARISDLEARLADSQARMQVVEAENNALTRDRLGSRAQAQREAVQWKKTAESTQEKLDEVTALLKARVSKSAEFKRVKQELEQAHSTIESLREQLEAAEEQSLAGKADSGSVSAQTDESTVKALTAKVEELTQKVKEREQQISMFMSFLDTANKEKEELRAKQKKLKQELSLSQPGSTAASSRAISPMSSPIVAPMALPPPPTFPHSTVAESPPPQSVSLDDTPTLRSRKRKIVDTSDSEADASVAINQAQAAASQPAPASSQAPLTKRKRAATTTSSPIPSPTSSAPPEAEADDDRPTTRSAARKRATAAASSKGLSTPEPTILATQASKQSSATASIVSAADGVKRRPGATTTSNMEVLVELGPIPKRARVTPPAIDTPAPLPPPSPPVIRSVSDLVRVSSTQLGPVLANLDQHVPLVQASIDGFLNAVNSWLLSFGSTTETSWSIQRSANMLRIPIPGGAPLCINLGYPEQELSLAVLVTALAPRIEGLVKSLVSRIRRSVCFYRIALVCPSVPTIALRAHYLDSLIAGANDFKDVFNNTLIFRPAVLPTTTASDALSQCVLEATVCAVKQKEIVNLLPNHVREWFTNAAMTDRGNILESLLNPSSPVFKAMDTFTLFKCLQLFTLIADTPRDSQALVSRLLFAAGQLSAPNMVLLVLRGVDFALHRSQKKPWTPTTPTFRPPAIRNINSRSYTHDILASILTHVKNPQDQRRVATSLSH
ncbi:hypothetical protein BCR44DRAFT_170829 [Catenaria anguillulae PL171]|uniref:Uncharacterized protein n=1 Tax=Catenaria anguillulae PL171 TaxID=765915 RepID=A0A1Y2HGA5_9FUNG|nr:hypothetical protein BCR44DRAFT_170829 [Catenaria anguillulae PL171]